MMSECPLAIRHKMEEYICRGNFVVRGRFLIFWSCGAFRLYLGASFCIYIFFLAHMYFLFLIGLSMIGGDTLMIYVSCFTLFIDLYL